MPVPDLTALCATNRRFNNIIMDSPKLFSNGDTDLLQFGLFVTAFQGNFRVVKLLLDSGLSPNFYYSGFIYMPPGYRRSPYDETRTNWKFLTRKISSTLRRNRLHLNRLLQLRDMALCNAFIDEHYRTAADE
ncbi:hypothetical protein F5Y13DRAFT_161849 [Hypoxylon sp. FL1857]|nr:hypothetical protein F5Y13DRAFT_161849 [Hypoxylon sp. FL1857]